MHSYHSWSQEAEMKKSNISKWTESLESMRRLGFDQGGLCNCCAHHHPYSVVFSAFRTSRIIKWKTSSSPASFPVQESLWQHLHYLCTSDAQGWAMVLNAVGWTSVGAVWTWKCRTWFWPIKSQRGSDTEKPKTMSYGEELKEPGIFIYPGRK